MYPPPAASDPAKTPLPNSFWVLPGKLLAGEYPGAPTPQHTHARLAQLLASGINSFIDLTEPDEVTAYDADLPRGIEEPLVRRVDVIHEPGRRDHAAQKNQGGDQQHSSLIPVA